MRLPFDKWASGLDLFALTPSFRASQKQKSLSTPIGLISTLIISIVLIIFMSLRYNTLTYKIGSIDNSIMEKNYYVGQDAWTFETGKIDPETGYDFEIAFGIYNATDFKPPVGIERIGQPKVYMFKMNTDANGGIVKERKELKMHQCNMGDIDIFNKLGQY